jgi:hypothetical protein
MAEPVSRIRTVQIAETSVTILHVLYLLQRNSRGRTYGDSLVLWVRSRKIFINEASLLTSRWAFHPGKTPPFTPYAVQLAGATAVQIQNERLNRSDDDGFGESDEIGSDASWVSQIRSYLKNMGMSDDRIASSDKMLRQVVRDLLLKHWNIVEAIAQELATIVPSKKPTPGVKLPELSAPEIGITVQKVDQLFYDKVKTLLASNE